MEVKLNMFLFTFRNQDANQVKYAALTARDVLIWACWCGTSLVYSPVDKIIGPYYTWMLGERRVD